MGDDPKVLKTLENWLDPSYLMSILEGESHRTRHSKNNLYILEWRY
jgi:hypothetical protein